MDLVIPKQELNSISNSFEKLIEDRYSQNQSILGMSNNNEKL